MHEPRLPHELVRAEPLHALMTWSRAEAGRGLVRGPIDVQIAGFGLPLDTIFG